VAGKSGQSVEKSIEFEVFGVKFVLAWDGEVGLDLTLNGTSIRPVLGITKDFLDGKVVQALMQLLYRGFLFLQESQKLPNAQQFECAVAEVQNSVSNTVIEEQIVEELVEPSVVVPVVLAV